MDTYGYNGLGPINDPRSMLSVSDSHWSHWSCAEKCAGPLSSFDPSRLVKLTMDHPEEIAMVKWNGVTSRLEYNQWLQNITTHLLNLINHWDVYNCYNQFFGQCQAFHLYSTASMTEPGQRSQVQAMAAMWWMASPKDSSGFMRCIYSLVPASGTADHLN